jgi:hypothetical protein
MMTPPVTPRFLFMILFLAAYDDVRDSQRDATKSQTFRDPLIATEP